MTPTSKMRRSKLQAARIFVLLFFAVMVGFYVTVDADVVALSGLWSIVLLLTVLLLLVALFFMT